MTDTDGISRSTPEDNLSDRPPKCSGGDRRTGKAAIPVRLKLELGVAKSARLQGSRAAVSLSPGLEAGPASFRMKHFNECAVRSRSIGLRGVMRCLNSSIRFGTGCEFVNGCVVNTCQPNSSPEVDVVTIASGCCSAPPWTNA